MYYMYFAVSLFLGICSITDFIFHSKLKVVRNIFDKVLLSFSCILCLVFAGIGVYHYNNQQQVEKEKLYIAYQYYIDNKFDVAKEYLNEINGKYAPEATIILASISMEQSNYGEANTLLKREVPFENSSASVKAELQAMCHAFLNQDNDTSTTVNEYIQNLETKNNIISDYEYKRVV